VAGTVIVLAILNACTTLPEEYIPTTVGPVSDPKPVNGLEVRLVPKLDHVIRGEPLFFNVIIRNVGQIPFWIPRKPHVVLIWTYPNGQRDNMMTEFPDHRFYDTANAIRLSPGEIMTTRLKVDTYYFPKPGVTEFHAVYYVSPDDTAGCQPFWHGRAPSNAYGVLVESPDRSASRSRIKYHGRS